MHFMPYNYISLQCMTFFSSLLIFPFCLQFFINIGFYVPYQFICTVVLASDLQHPLLNSEDLTLRSNLSSITHFVNLGKSLSLFMPQFPDLSTGVMRSM